MNPALSVALPRRSVVATRRREDALERGGAFREPLLGDPEPVQRVRETEGLVRPALIDEPVDGRQELVVARLELSSDALASGPLAPALACSATSRSVSAVRASMPDVMWFFPTDRGDLEPCLVADANLCALHHRLRHAQGEPAAPGGHDTGRERSAVDRALDALLLEAAEGVNLLGRDVERPTARRLDRGPSSGSER